MNSRGKQVRLRSILTLVPVLSIFCLTDAAPGGKIPSSRQISSKNRQSGDGNTMSSWFGEKEWFKKLSQSKLFKSTRKTFKDMSYDELKEARAKQKPDTETFIKYTERMVSLCDDAAERADLVLELADGLREIGKLDPAAARYAEFSQFYPGHAKTEYALYRAVDCSFKRTRTFDRDQSKTLDTIELANTFLERPGFAGHRDDVEKIRTACYERLIASELNVCDFYLKAEKIHAVERRIDSIKTTMLKFAPEMEEQVIAMAERLPGGGTISTDLSHSPLIQVAANKKGEELKERAVGAPVKVAQVARK